VNKAVPGGDHKAVVAMVVDVLIEGLRRR